MIFKDQAKETLENINKFTKAAAENETELSAALSTKDNTEKTFIQSVIEFIKTLKTETGTNKALEAVVLTLKECQTATTVADALREKCIAINKELNEAYEKHDIAVKSLRNLEECRPS